MTLQTPLSNVYLIVIPRNYTNDIHICGRCKVQYTHLDLFIEHKNICNVRPDDLMELKSDNTDGQKIEVENLIELNELGNLEESDKDASQLITLNSLLNKNSFKNFKVDPVENNDNCIMQNDVCMNSNIEQKVDFKRNLQNDEEDIATLLANQLSSETSADDINAEGNAELQPDETLEENDPPKENEEKEENKVLYRGKMRKLFTCDVEGCKYKTLLRKDIERHARVHTGERPFKCYLCPKAFTRTDKLLLHQRIHAGDKRYKCTKCDYASVDSGSLIKHLRVHNGERPFKCQLCSYRARDSSQLTVHLRTHTGDSPFVCTNENCKAAFKTNSDLKRHMVVHTGEKPHSCLYCPYKCTLKRNLQIHIQSQHPNGELKEYKCHLCPRFILPTIRRLKNHMKKHHGEVEPEETNMESNQPTENNLVDKQENYKKKRRKSKRNNDKIAVGVMNKAYDCKLCDASFVCQESLLTHERYHNKIQENRKTASSELQMADDKKLFKSTNRRFCEEEENHKRIHHYSDNMVLNDGYIVDNNTFNDSLRNAEILASLNPVQGNGNIRQYVMIAPGTIQNNYSTEDFALAQN